MVKIKNYSTFLMRFLLQKTEHIDSQLSSKNKIRWWSHAQRMALTVPQSKAHVIRPEGKDEEEGHKIIGNMTYQNDTNR